MAVAEAESGSKGSLPGVNMGARLTGSRGGRRWEQLGYRGKAPGLHEALGGVKQGEEVGVQALSLSALDQYTGRDGIAEVGAKERGADLDEGGCRGTRGRGQPPPGVFEGFVGLPDIVSAEQVQATGIGEGDRRLGWQAAAGVTALAAERVGVEPRYIAVGGPGQLDSSRGQSPGWG